MRTNKSEKRLAEELLTKRIGVSVACSDRTAIEIDIFPTVLSSEKVRALVRWRGANVESSLIVSAGVGSRIGQMLVLTYLATTPAASPSVGALLDGWCALALTFPDPMGLDGDKIRVELHRSDWIVTSYFSKDPSRNDELLLPPEFQSLGAGAALVEATSHLLLGRRFLSSDSIRDWQDATWVVPDPVQHEP